MAQVFWHNLKAEEAVKTLRTDFNNGLSEKEVEVRVLEFGKNKLPEEKPLSQVKIFFEQFESPLIYILVIAGAVTLFLKEFTDSIVIFGAVVLNTIIGYFQETKASKALRELKKAVHYEARVLREGSERVIDSSELVPGDVFILNPGDKVPADGRIIESSNLKINEMTLTGEWLSAKKKPDVLPKETPLADRDNMVYMGTIIEDGRARVIITETGIQTEIGKVAEMLKETKEEKTPLQKKLAHFSKVIAIVISIIAFLIFIGGVLIGRGTIEMFTTAVAVAVAAIPEGLPIAMTVILALGMQRILKRKGLVRKLLAAETLGNTSIIATDKTLTLTEGKMKVTEVFSPKNDNNELALKIAFLSNEAFIENPKEPKEEWIVRGRPTDKALLMAGIDLGFSKEEIGKEEKRINEIPFDSVRKYGLTLYESSGMYNLYMLGAPEKLFEFSNIPPKDLEKINNKLEDLTNNGYRVVGTACKKLQSEPENLEEEIKDLDFVGLIALRDPLRKDVKEAMKLCLRAGMKPIIVTGDHKLTAKAIANEIGLSVKDENVIEGKDLEKLSDEAFKLRLNDIQVYARVEPKDKLRIISAWQEEGRVVAMTGDGINDAPALKKADIGIALGSGTEVAKETSDLILLNDSFSVIVAAVEEGRVILDNIKKVITYLLSDSLSEIVLIGVALIFVKVLPILPAQILWINLVEDGLPGIALAFEPKEKDIMNQKPKGIKDSLFNKDMKILIVIIGIITNSLILALFFWLWGKEEDIVYIRTMVFAALTVGSLFYIFACKSLRRNIWNIDMFANKFLNISVLIGFAVLILSIYLPSLQNLLKLTPEGLGLYDWFIVLSIGVINLALIEVAKWILITKKKLA